MVLKLLENGLQLVLLIENSGDFVLQLTNFGHSFEGFYEENGRQLPWIGNRIDSTSYYSNNCWLVPSQGTFAGQWYYGTNPGDTFDVCIIDDGEVEISYTYNGNKNGYGIGNFDEDFPGSMQVTWFEKNINGIAMYRLSEENQLLESFWAGVTSADEVYFKICNDDQLNALYWAHHSVNHMKLMSPVENRQRCGRNRDLFDPYFFVAPSPPSEDSISSKLSITISLLIGLCFIII